MADDLRTRPAVVGGLIAGVLSVLPFIQQCCCLWALVGGAIAAQMLIARSPAESPAMRPRLVSGRRSSGIIYFFIGLPLSLATLAWRLRLLEEFSTRSTTQSSGDHHGSRSTGPESPFRTQLLSMVPQFLVVGVSLRIYCAGHCLTGALREAQR
jgi:hypothetical protein